ncbi:ABC transporter ATP-binding protein [Endozoicomonas ascidiicola]|uniref:ABC transporter ATP-binding protein n=1 Tax=Endozoicomonas ascidiicola TaxID=1698521 RepID=UPI000834ED0F|nr:ABC transporter ATP-binding protein [Endozoicomonas ascidiicola]
MNLNALEITDLACSYNSQRKKPKDALSRSDLVLSDLNLAIEDGEIVCLLGRSGCGKSTLLKAIAGIIQPVAGTINIHGHEVSSARKVTPPEQRGIGMIFQDYALFPHLTVFENIAFGLNKSDSTTIKHRVREMLELVNLFNLEKRYPHELSGGQQQRVAIARALANKPSILLLDEPFSNIDSQVRQHLIREIRDILKQQKVAGLFVTHSREEGFAFADKVAVMGQGRIMQYGTASDVYHHPDNRFIADFMGAGNVLPVSIKDEYHVETPIGLLKSTRPLSTNSPASLELFVRPQMVEIKPVHNTDNSYPQATVSRQQFMGKTIRSEIQVDCCQGKYQLVAEHSSLGAEGSMVFSEGAPAHVNIIPHELVLFDADGQALTTTTPATPDGLQSNDACAHPPVAEPVP